MTEQIKKQNDKEQAKTTAQEKKRMELASFYKCKDACVCLKPSGKCNATKLKECPVCHNILPSVCSNAACRGEDGKKPEMVIPFCEQVVYSTQKMQCPEANLSMVEEKKRTMKFLQKNSI